MAERIVLIIEGKKPSCSYRYMIYEVMGLDYGYYSELYPVMQDLTNALCDVEMLKFNKDKN